MRYVALLRGINVGGHRRLPMAELRKIAEDLGLSDPRTYIASGNLVFGSDEIAAALEKKLEAAIYERLGFEVDVIVRSAAQWAAYCAGNPMRRQADDQPNLVMVTFGKRAATDADAAALRKQASQNERVEHAGDVIWIWFGDGAGRSRIGTGGGIKEVWTTRNWRTVCKLQEMLTD